MDNLNQWKKVLDNITGTAIFVVEQGTRKILYYNKYMEQIQPGFSCGEICGSVWNGSCANCPLKDIGEKDCNKAVSYATPFGKPMDATATKIVWGDTPAFLISISNHPLTGRELELELGRTQMHIAVSQIYTMVISVNLTKNRYFMVEYANYVNQNAPDSGVFDELIEHGIQSMHPDFQEEFSEKFKREHLLEHFARGENTQYMEHRQMGMDGIYHWTDTHVIHIENPYNHDVLQVSLCRNIDKEKQLEAQVLEAVSKEKEASKRFAVSIRDMYQSIYEVELTQGKVSSYQCTEDGLRCVPIKGYYPGMILAIEERMVSEESRRKYQENMSTAQLKERLTSEDKQIYFEYQRKDSQGKYRWYSNQIQLLSDCRDDFRILIFVRDIDDRRRADEQKKQRLKEALADARKANHAKSDFISRMSHDIRTPINAILGMSTIASSNLGDSVKLKDCLEKIEVSTRYLMSMMSDILDMSRIESGKLMLVEKEFCLNSMIRGLIITFTSQVAQKRQHFELLMDQAAEGNYIGDELKINQMLMNLLGNASKYTGEEGKITLEIRKKSSTQEQTVLQITVKDTGIGISEEFQEIMFSPFEQENEAGGRVFEGSGLGLSLTKHLLERMGGSITCTSKPNQGSCFIIELPLKSVKKVKEQDKFELDPPNLEGFHKEHILVVEDNEINLEIVKTLLEGKNLVVEAAQNGLEAVKKFQASPPYWYQLILMDIRMPVMDGFTATRKIRELKRPDSKTIPIVALTANALQEDCKYAQDVGMNAFLTKPIDIEVLHRNLKQYI